MSDRLNQSRAIIIQARMSSERFPGKALALLGGRPLIEYVYGRCRQSDVPHVLVATSTDATDDVLSEFCQKKDIPFFRGDLGDVLGRYIDAARFLGVRYIARVCGDTPLVDIALLEQQLSELIIQGHDYVACDRRSCFSAFYSEAVSLAALEKAHVMTSSPQDREHVTRFVLAHPDVFSVRLIDSCLMVEGAGKMRLTVDYPEDLAAVERVLNKLTDKTGFTSDQVVRAIERLDRDSFHG